MLFGSSGIRRPYGSDLPSLALHLGSAIGCPGARILVGRDTRTTGPVLETLISAGLLGSGANVCLAGVVPTPVVAFGTRYFDTGVMITASHNPENYNGFKLLRPDGSSFIGSDQDKVRVALETRSLQSWDQQGTLSFYDALSPYIQAVTRGIGSAEGVKMVLDCGNGAGSMITPLILDMLGVRVSCVNTNPQGHFARPSEPLEEYLSHLPPLIRKTRSAGGIAHDGDADRLMAFDNRGRFISGDQLMMLFILYLGTKKVVTSFDASMAIEEVAEVRRTPVGDSFISDELCRWGDFGGEPSGAWIFPGHSLCPDGPYAAALFCEIASAGDIAEQIDSMPKYPVIRKSFPCENATEVLSALGAANPTDGLRVSGEEGWFLVRASGTEPKIRITAEGRDRFKAREMFEKGVKAVKAWKAA
ncbi:MAG: phosphopentomutase/phosphoglucosamine mutase [Methanoregulaceae archaeon]|nr:phosphopentomutase/phosphoglucosamine mutase [Methanoregulaceae archaeon]